MCSRLRAIDAEIEWVQGMMLGVQYGSEPAYVRQMTAFSKDLAGRFQAVFWAEKAKFVSTAGSVEDGKWTWHIVMEKPGGGKWIDIGSVCVHDDDYVDDEDADNSGGPIISLCFVYPDVESIRKLISILDGWDGNIHSDDEVYFCVNDTKINKSIYLEEFEPMDKSGQFRWKGKVTADISSAKGQMREREFSYESGKVLSSKDLNTLLFSWEIKAVNDDPRLLDLVLNDQTVPDEVDQLKWEHDVGDKLRHWVDKVYIPAIEDGIYPGEGTVEYTQGALHRMCDDVSATFEHDWREDPTAGCVLRYCKYGAGLDTLERLFEDKGCIQGDATSVVETRRYTDANVVLFSPTATSDIAYAVAEMFPRPTSAKDNSDLELRFDVFLDTRPDAHDEESEKRFPRAALMQKLCADHTTGEWESLVGTCMEIEEILWGIKRDCSNPIRFNCGAGPDKDDAYWLQILQMFFKSVSLKLHLNGGKTMTGKTKADRGLMTKEQFLRTAMGDFTTGADDPQKFELRYIFEAEGVSDNFWIFYRHSSKANRAGSYWIGRK